MILTCVQHPPFSFGSWKKWPWSLYQARSKSSCYTMSGCRVWAIKKLTSAMIFNIRVLNRKASKKMRSQTKKPKLIQCCILFGVWFTLISRSVCPQMYPPYMPVINGSYLYFRLCLWFAHGFVVFLHEFVKTRVEVLLHLLPYRLITVFGLNATPRQNQHQDQFQEHWLHFHGSVPGIHSFPLLIIHALVLSWPWLVP